jgi:hypothetical protein
MTIYKKIFFAVLIICSFSVLSYCQIIDERTGITIEFEVDDNTFPESWKTAEINASGVSLDPSEMKRSASIIIMAMKKYPIGVLKNNLKKIYILSSMKFYNVNYGGTNSSDVVYVSNSGVADGYTDYYIEKTFHQEFSSILLRNYPSYFDKDRWQGNNRVHYRNGGVLSIESNTDGQNFDSLLNKNGLLYEYATSDLENDFNSFAENLFVPVPEFWVAVEKYPDLYNKAEIIIGFYNRIDEKFTKKYFKGFN